MTKFNRRSIRLPGYDYNQPGAYFITLVTHNRISLFGEIIDGQMLPNEYGKVALQQWDRLPKKFRQLSLSERILMPNHFHGILILSDENQEARKPTSHGVIPGSLGAIIRAYKLAVIFRIKLMANNGIEVWQRNYYEHIIRNDEEMQKIFDYIRTNPLRWSDDRFFIA